MDKYFDQPLVVVNIEGAGSIVGSQEALEAPADGYTLLWHHHSMLTSNVMGLADFTWDSYTPVLFSCIYRSYGSGKSNFTLEHPKGLIG